MKLLYSFLGKYELGGRVFKLIDLTYAAHVLIKRTVCEKLAMIVTTREEIEEYMTKENVLLLFTDQDWHKLFALLLETGGEVNVLTFEEFLKIDVKTGEEIKKKLMDGFDFTKTASDYIDLLRGLIARTSKLMKDSPAQ
jgi:hypothetical protein